MYINLPVRNRGLDYYIIKRGISTVMHKFNAVTVDCSHL
jgi:hypothetical protein